MSTILLLIALSISILIRQEVDYILGDKCLDGKPTYMSRWPEWREMAGLIAGIALFVFLSHIVKVTPPQIIFSYTPFEYLKEPFYESFV